MAMVGRLAASQSSGSSRPTRGSPAWPARPAAAGSPSVDSPSRTGARAVSILAKRRVAQVDAVERRAPICAARVRDSSEAGSRAASGRRPRRISRGGGSAQRRRNGLIDAASLRSTAEHTDLLSQHQQLGAGGGIALESDGDEVKK